MTFLASFCVVFIFAFFLLFVSPFFAIIFAVLTLSVFVGSQVVSGRRTFQENVEPTDQQPTNQQPTNSEAHIQASESTTQTIDTSLLLLRKVQKDDPIVTCEICLDNVVIGEELAGSPNKNCIHEFHTGCIQQALHLQSTCPCCQREFLHPMEVTFNPAATTPVPPVSNIPTQEEYVA